MKKLIVLTAACIATLIATNIAQAKYRYGRIPYVRTIPIILTPIVNPVIGAFWAAAAVVGVFMEVDEALCEPLDKYRVGIQHSTRSSSAEISWPGGEYPTRDFQTERVYDYNPKTGLAFWWTRTTFTSYPLGAGGPIVEINYSSQPPAENDFNNMDVSYERTGNANFHESTFIFDTYESCTAYCYRAGGFGFTRPVMAIYNGYTWLPVWRSDILYHSPVGVYVDYHYLMVDSWGYALYKPHWEAGFNTELPDGGGVATLYSSPNF